MQNGTCFVSRAALFLALLVLTFFLCAQRGVSQTSYDESMSRLLRNSKRIDAILTLLFSPSMTLTSNWESFSALYNELTQLKLSSNEIISDLEKQITSMSGSLESTKTDLENAMNYSKKQDESIEKISKLYNDYRAEAYKRIKHLEFWNMVWKILCLILGIGTVVETAYLLWPK